MKEGGVVGYSKRGILSKDVFLGIDWFFFDFYRGYGVKFIF